MSHPLLCWDIASEGIQKLLCDPKNIDLYWLQKLEHKYEWITDLHKLVTGNEYEAVIVSNKKQTIIWAGEGLMAMTGYSASFAKNKKPSFLQGKDTCHITKKRIKEQLAENGIVKETILNYRKSGEPYECMLHIFPLFNKNAVCSHFIALEKSLGK